MLDSASDHCAFHQSTLLKLGVLIKCGTVELSVQPDAYLFYTIQVCSLSMSEK